MAQDEHMVVLEHEAFPGLPAFVGATVVALVHPLVPVGQHVPGELGGEVDHAEREVGVVEVEVVRDGPHDDEVDVLVTQLPGDDSRGASHAVLIVHGNHDLLVSRVNLPLVKT